jgi:indolepyruvate ferredoxin oxidoreductase
VLRTLYAARGVRGTRLDPFGGASTRRLERGLIDEYQQLVDRALIGLTPANAAQVAALAGLPDVIRGYEHVKERSVVEYRRRATAMIGTLGA